MKMQKYCGTHCTCAFVFRYNKNLAGAQKAGEKRGFLSGLGIGLMWLIIFSIFAIAFYYGNNLVGDEENARKEAEEKGEEYTARYTGGTIVMVS